MNGNQFVAALIVAQLLVVGGFALGSHVSTDITPDWDAQKTANITCYSWVENGSAEVSCPSVV